MHALQQQQPKEEPEPPGQVFDLLGLGDEQEMDRQGPGDNPEQHLSRENEVTVDARALRDPAQALCKPNMPLPVDEVCSRACRWVIINM